MFDGHHTTADCAIIFNKAEMNQSLLAEMVSHISRCSFVPDKVVGPTSWVGPPLVCARSWCGVHFLFTSALSRRSSSKTKSISASKTSGSSSSSSSSSSVVHPFDFIQGGYVCMSQQHDIFSACVPGFLVHCTSSDAHALMQRHLPGLLFSDWLVVGSCPNQDAEGLHAAGLRIHPIGELESAREASAEEQAIFGECGRSEFVQRFVDADPGDDYNEDVLRLLCATGVRAPVAQAAKKEQA